MNIKRIQLAAAGSALALAAAVVVAPAASAEPKPVPQGYGMPASGMCDTTTAVEWANVPGAPATGWGMGWGPWLNDGKGGPACVRVLVFNNSTQSWTASTR